MTAHNLCHRTAENMVSTMLIITACVHYTDVIMGAMASQITSLTMVYSTVYSGADPRKHQSSASLAFVRGIHRSPVNPPHKWPVMRKIFPFDDVVMWPIVYHFYQRCGVCSLEPGTSWFISSYWLLRQLVFTGWHFLWTSKSTSKLMTSLGCIQLPELYPITGQNVPRLISWRFI